jgi:hypothetical protein
LTATPDHPSQSGERPPPPAHHTEPYVFFLASTASVSFGGSRSIIVVATSRIVADADEGFRLLSPDSFDAVVRKK